MKKILYSLILVLCLILLAGCGDSEAKLSLKLESNPTTGYDWEYIISNEEVLELVSDEFVSNNSELVGSGGIKTYVFKPLKEGDVYIEFNYRRSFEDEENPLYKMYYTFKIDKDLKISFENIEGDYSSETLPEPIINN